MTLASLLWFAVVYLKYEVTPEALRYIWWLVWSQVRATAHAVHRRLVIQGRSARLSLPRIAVCALSRLSIAFAELLWANQQFPQPCV